MPQPTHPGAEPVSSQPPLNAETLVQEQDQATHEWHQDAGTLLDGNSDPASDAAPSRLSLHLHAANFRLWHLEDEARDGNAADRTIVECKRSIDRTNQRRNNLVERIDETLLHLFVQDESAPLHSETPGQIVDRLSILALKIYHTGQEAERPSASVEHRQRNAQRLGVLMEQREDLRTALGILLEQIAGGKRRFRLYRQMKMYNDPDLNPVLYTAAKRGSVHTS